MTKGERLKQFREHLGDNQQDFAAKIDTSQAHLSSMESGNRSISVAITMKVATEFSKLNLDWLHHGRGEMLFKKRTQKDTPIAESTHLNADFEVKIDGDSYNIVSNFDDYVVLKRVNAGKI